jgi:hypothetical protein
MQAVAPEASTDGWIVVFNQPLGCTKQNSNHLASFVRRKYPGHIAPPHQDLD